MFACVDCVVVANGGLDICGSIEKQIYLEICWKLRENKTIYLMVNAGSLRCHKLGVANV
jgi:hypothetical protein